MSNDPVGVLGHASIGGITGYIHGFNRYAYVNNNPYNYTDPSGMCAKADHDDITYVDCDSNATEETEGEGPIEEVRVIGRRHDGLSGQRAYDYLSGLARAGAFGPGKWVTTDINYRGTRNWLLFLANRISRAEEGKAPGNPDLEQTKRDVTQTWKSLSKSERLGLLESGVSSVERQYGSTRTITQTYLPAPDGWRPQGTNPHTWLPHVLSPTFELKD